MTATDLDARLDALLQERFPRVHALPEEEWFVETRAISSFDFLNLITELETRFQITIPDDDADEDHIGSKARLRTYLQRRLSETDGT